MAYVKILRNRNVVALESYLFKGRESDDPLELNGCTEGFISEQFIGTQMHFGEKKYFDAIHIIQSFEGEDSSKLSPEEYTRVGRKMAEDLFPGHEFCVVTHTDEAHVHNHIILNPVHSDTGKRIHNKTKVLYDLRDKSDELCLEKGLSIIEKQSKKTWEKTPEHVREMNKKSGFSWVLDLKEKADFARTIATSFDEYAGILNQFGIQVRVENKTVGYFYPGKRQKRGDTYGLGEKYTKSGLIAQFKENYQKFESVGLKKTPIEQIEFRDHWKFHRSSKDLFVPSYRYKDLVIPKELIRIIQGIDLKEYGENLGQKFFLDSEGATRMHEKLHVHIKDNRWLNDKTKTQGGAFEFINYCHGESWLETLKRFDTTGRVQKVLEVAENKTPSFKAFYAPVPFRQKKEKQRADISGFFFESSKVLSTLSKDKRVQSFPSGKIKFRSETNPNLSLTVHKLNNSWATRKPSGIQGTFFSRIKNSKDSLILFEDPVAFLSSGKLLDRILNNRRSVNVLVPLKPLDDFLKERKAFIKKYPRCHVVRSKEHFFWGPKNKERSISESERSEWEKALGIRYSSIEDLLKELILGRTR